MSRDLQDENYYISNSRKIPVKWTAPEVGFIYQDFPTLLHSFVLFNKSKCKNVFLFSPLCIRLFTFGNIPLKVMFGVLELCCMRFGALDTNHLKITQIKRYYVSTKYQHTLL